MRTIHTMSNEWPSNLPQSSEFPPVSIITPTYNRRRFLPWLVKSIQLQTYPLERMEWLIYDDGTDPIQDLLLPHMKTLNIRYFSSKEKRTIGMKRNFLHKEAKGEILVMMDDDDYYSPQRVAHAVRKLISSKLDLAGSSKNQLYFSDDASIWEVGPYGKYHATFGTMAFRKKLLHTCECDESLTYAEEQSFTKRYSIPMVQLDPMKTMLVMCHSENTFNKNALRTDASPFVRNTQLKLQAFIKSKEQREFYSNA